MTLPGQGQGSDHLTSPSTHHTVLMQVLCQQRLGSPHTVRAPPATTPPLASAAPEVEAAFVVPAPRPPAKPVFAAIARVAPKRPAAAATPPTTPSTPPTTTTPATASPAAHIKRIHRGEERAGELTWNLRWSGG